MPVERECWRPEREEMPVEQVRALQESRLREIVTWAYEQTVFYRRKFDQAGVHPSDIRTLEDLRHLPVTTKDEFRRSQEEAPPWGLHCSDPRAIYRTYWSSGTTGKPTFMGVSADEAEQWDEMVARSLWAAGLRPGDTFHHATQLAGFAGGYGFLVGAQKIGANIVPAGAGNTERHVYLIAALRPSFIKILPSYACFLGETARRLGHDPSTLGVRHLYLSAEPLPDTLRQRIETMWGARATSSYGLSDVAQPQGYECRYQTGQHDVSDWNITEIVDPETGEPRERGTGVLVFTNLVRRAIPVIRFWSNDLTSWSDTASCPCGRTGRLYANPLGRVDDVTKVKGINLWPSAVASILNRFDALTGQFKIVVENPRGRDTLSVTVECQEGLDSRALESLRSDVTTRLTQALMIAVDEVSLVPFGSQPRGDHKQKVLEDRRVRT